MSIVLLVTACGGKSPPPQSEPAPPQDVAAPSAPAPSPAPAPVRPPTPSPPTPRPNPFAADSKLYLQAPAFDQIRESDYLPSMVEGIRLENEEIKKIAESAAAPTFENTIVAMEQTGDMLLRTEKVFFNLSQSLDDDAMEKIKAE